MRKTFNFKDYRPELYDENFCLKPPLLLWVAIVFLSRAAALLVVGLLMRIGGGSSADTDSLLRGLIDARSLLPSAVAFVVLWALIRRTPSASRPIRWIWQRGRPVLAAAAVLDIGRGVLAYQSAADAQSLMLLTVVAAFDTIFLAYILFSRRVRDAFNDFPAMVN